MDFVTEVCGNWSVEGDGGKISSMRISRHERLRSKCFIIIRRCINRNGTFLSPLTKLEETFQNRIANVARKCVER